MPFQSEKDISINSRPTGTGNISRPSSVTLNDAPFRNTSIEDEDVVLEGTPLHEYVKNLCLNDDGSNPTLDWILHKKENLHSFWHQASMKDFVRHQWKAFRRKLRNLVPLSNDILVNLSHFYFLKYGKELLDSQIILEEDLDYLCLRVPQQFFIAAKSKSNRLDNENSMRGLLFFAVIIAFFSCILFQSFPLWICVVFALLIVLLLAFCIRLQVIKLLCKHKHEQNRTSLQDFLQLSKRLSASNRRSIRLIQEIEVVSRGYALVNGKTPITRLERQSKQKRSLPRLRLLLLRTLLTCIMAYRDATLSLLRYKLKDDDDTSYYICNVPLAEIGIDYSQVTSSDELFRSTDGCSLSSLKSLDELLAKQRSELLTRLFLMLASVTNESDNEDSANFFDYLVTPSQMTGNSLQLLQSCYEAHKNVEVAKSDNSASPTCANSETAKPISSIQINLHSLTVHLRAALIKSVELENSVSSSETLPCLVTDAIREVEKHLDASKNCCAGSLKELESEDQPVHPVELPPPLQKQPELKADDVSDTTSSVDYTEDKVYEAINLDDPAEKQMSDDFDVVEKQNREESSVVIRELQSVLAYVTSEKQREMWKQQLFPSYRARISKEPNIIQSQEDENGSVIIDDSEETHFIADGSKDSLFSKDNATSNVENVADSRAPCLEDSLGPDKLPKLEENIENVEHIRPSETNSKSEMCSDTSNPSDSACYEIAEGVANNVRLKFHKRIAPPGRLPSKTLKHKVGSSFMGGTGDHNNTNQDTSDCNLDSPPEWTRGLGIGFSNSLALQAVNLAKQRSNFLPSSEKSLLTCGGDSSDED